MPLYENSVIYKLVHKEDLDNNNIYIGSTTNFRGRKLKHKENCYYESSKAHNYYVYQFIRENGGWDEWEMVAVETYPCESKRELEIRERFHIETLKSKLNGKIPYRSRKEYYEDNKEIISIKSKEYRQDNKEKIIKRSKKYYEDNKEIISIKSRIYYEDNIENIIEYGKNRYLENREKILEQCKEKITCECGCILTKTNLNRHRKSDTHKKKMEELNN